MTTELRISLEPDADREVASLRSAYKTFTTATEPVAAVVDLTASFEWRRLTVIAGPSGSGKSTTLAMLGCLERPDRGEVMLSGRRIDSLSQRDRRALRRRRIGLVQPQPSDNLLEALSSFDNLRWAGRLRAGHDAPDEHLYSLLDQTGLGDAAAKSVRQLSGGEQQRLALACALVGAPELVVADEPTASLDRQSSADVIVALRDAADRGVTLVVASHDQHLIDAADLVVWLDHGRRVS